MLAENDSERTACSADGGALWPTPSACCANDGEGAETWLARRETLKAKHINGNGAGIPLAIAVQVPQECVPASSTWSSAAPLASRLRQLVSAVASPTTDGCGARLCASSATSAHGMPYWRTPQGCLAFDTPMGSRPLDEYSTSYPRWGTVSAGASGEHVMSALRTDGSASSSWDDEQTQWSTPRCAMASMYAEDDETFDGRGKETRETLARQAARQWMTPLANDALAKDHSPSMQEQRPSRHAGRPLCIQVHEGAATAWRSPRASDGAKGGPNQVGSKGDLMLPSAAVQAENWATPTVNTAKNNGAQSQQQRHGPCLDGPPTAHGQLSARWVALLMGLPSDYLSIPPLLGRAGQRVQAAPGKTTSPPD